MTRLPIADPPPFKKQPFDSDLLARAGFADDLTKTVPRLVDGGVLCIDAPWGEGKTWFAKNWQAKLQSEGFSTAYVDAFKKDYVDDPFLVFAAALQGMARTERPAVIESFSKAARRVGASLLPALSRLTLEGLAFAAGAPGAGAAVGSVAAAASSGVTDLANRVAEHELKRLESQEVAFAEFRTELATFTSGLTKPAVILVDELDRCNPAFAVRLLERMKHYFESPNLVFVLLMHRRQMEAAIAGVYGTAIDAPAYLNKFIHVTLRLPKVAHSYDTSELDNYKVLKHFRNHLAQDDQERFGDISEFLADLTTHLGLSLRDTHRAMLALLVAAPMRITLPLGAYFICVRMARPELYAGLRAHDQGAHRECLGIVSRTGPGSMRHGNFQGLLKATHMLALQEQLPESHQGSDYLRQMINATHSRDIEAFLRNIFRRIDLTE